MFPVNGLSKASVLTGVGLVALLAQPLDAEPLVPEPRDRSTPETIGFQAVEEEHMSNTAITGALAAPSADAEEDGQIVEPVWFSEAFMRARDMEPEDLMKRREYLLNTDSIRGSGPAQVRPRAFQNRVYDPSSSVSTEHRPGQ